MAELMSVSVERNGRLEEINDEEEIAEELSFQLDKAAEHLAKLLQVTEGVAEEVCVLEQTCSQSTRFLTAWHTLLTKGRQTFSTGTPGEQG